jgi:putative dimethyl sulfoxide reductase chaperone
MLSSQIMFSEGIETLLLDRSGFQIVGHETDADRAIEAIRILQPDVVIMDCKDLDLASAATVASIMNEAPNTKIIALNLTDDRIRVYRSEQRAGRSSIDLLEALEDEISETGQITDQEWIALSSIRTQVYGDHAAIFNFKVDEDTLNNLNGNALNLIGEHMLGEDLTGDLQTGVEILRKFHNELMRGDFSATLVCVGEDYERLVRCGQGATDFSQATESFFSMKWDCSVSSTWASVMKAYQDAGTRLSRNAQLHPDFIGSELNFMKFLCSKENCAWRKKDRLLAAKFQAAECLFIKKHLIRWIPHYSTLLASQAKSDFYRGIAHLTKGFIFHEAYRVVEFMELNALVSNYEAEMEGGEK